MTRSRSKAQTFLQFITEASPNPLYLTPDTVRAMDEAGLKEKLFATYLFEVRHTLNVDVQSIREGRKVVAYTLGRVGVVNGVVPQVAHDPTMPTWPEREDF